MAARTLNYAVSNDPPEAPGATTVVFKSPYPGNGGSARMDLLSRRTRGIKMEENSKNTTNKSHNTKTSTTTIKIKPKPHTTDLDAERNPFARRGSVSRFSPMLVGSDSGASECSAASLTVEGKQLRAKQTKSQAPKQTGNRL